MVNAVIHNSDFCFHSVLLDREDVKIDNTNYYCNSIPVPRVSQILDIIKEDGLMDWAFYMGKYGKDYKKISQDALDYGTEFHRRAEIYLDPESTDEDKFNVESEEPMKSFDAFLKWIYNYKDRIEIIAQEMTLSCQWFGGTFDLLCTIDDKLTLVDYKTSKTITYKYLLQLAAYNYLLVTQRGIIIDQMIILQLDKRSGNYVEYVIDLHDPIQNDFNTHNTNTFLSMVYTYYSIATVRNTFTNNKYKGEQAYDVRKE